MKKYFLLGVIFIVAISSLYIYYTINKKFSPAPYAKIILEKCASSSHRPTCYDTELPKLMSSLTMEEVFEITKIIQKKDDSYWFCHGLGHKLSAKEYEKDPKDWKDVMTRCAVGMCSNGCLHGALSKHFSSEWLNESQLSEFMPDLKSLCEARGDWQPTPQQKSSCYHELGHLSLYLTNTDIEKAAKLCHEIAVKPNGENHLMTCQEGIFMQIFEPREPEDFALIYSLVPLRGRLKECDDEPYGVEKGACWKIGWKGEEADFCRKFDRELSYACFREAWVINDDKIETPQGIIQYCSYSEEPQEISKCFNKLYYSLMAKHDFDTDWMIDLCKKMPNQLMPQCFAKTASRLIETDKNLIDRAAFVCKTAEKYTSSNDCYKELIYYAGFVFNRGDEFAVKLCQALDRPWRKKCLDHQNDASN